MNDGGYVVFLLLGVALVAADGLLIYRSGVRYLANAHAARSSATSMARLVTVLFVLVVLGILALVSVIDVDAGGALQTVVARLGVLLLILAAAHAITIAVLNQMRDRLNTETLTMERIERNQPDTQVTAEASGATNVEPAPPLHDRQTWRS